MLTHGLFFPSFIYVSMLFNIGGYIKQVQFNVLVFIISDHNDKGDKEDNI